MEWHPPEKKRPGIKVLKTTIHLLHEKMKGNSEAGSECSAMAQRLCGVTGLMEALNQHLPFEAVCVPYPVQQEHQQTPLKTLVGAALGLWLRFILAHNYMCLLH